MTSMLSLPIGIRYIIPNIIFFKKKKIRAAQAPPVQNSAEFFKIMPVGKVVFKEYVHIARRSQASVNAVLCDYPFTAKFRAKSYKRQFLGGIDGDKDFFITVQYTLYYSFFVKSNDVNSFNSLFNFMYSLPSSSVICDIFSSIFFCFS